jgi:hypothetical protein
MANNKHELRCKMGRTSCSVFYTMSIFLTMIYGKIPFSLKKRGENLAKVSIICIIARDLSIKYFSCPSMRPMILNKPIYEEYIPCSVSHLSAHEHDLVYNENFSTNVATCCTCNSCYCNKCGREISQFRQQPT